MNEELKILLGKEYSDYVIAGVRRKDGSVDARSIGTDQAELGLIEILKLSKDAEIKRKIKKQL